MQGMSPTDEELVARAQDGDASSFDVLVRRGERKIRGAIYRIVGSDDEALDLCQETFLKAYRGLGSFKREARFSSWLYQIALNLCRDRLRRKRGKTWVSLDDLEDGAAAPQTPGPTALDLVEARDLSRTVAVAVAALPEEQREVIVLKEYQGLTFLEIAEVLGLPMSTVKTRLYRGLGQLKDQLERQGVHGATAVRAQQA
jgi:RNA polymerase sigma-70 factor (ECF subfamily)